MVNWRARLTAGKDLTWYPSNTGPLVASVASRPKVNLKASSSCGVFMLVVKSVFNAGVEPAIVIIELTSPSTSLVEITQVPNIGELKRGLINLKYFFSMVAYLM